MHSFNNFIKHPSLMDLSIVKVNEKNIKPVEEWIYGSLNISGNTLNMNFKNQKAFNGYQKNRIDLFKSFFLKFLFFYYSSDKKCI